MSENELTHLIKMTNQIALNIGIGCPEEDTIDKIENHINAFWAPPMREKICLHIHTHQNDLNPIAVKALLRIKAKL